MEKTYDKSKKPVRQKVERKFDRVENAIATADVPVISVKSAIKAPLGHNSRMIEWQRYGPDGTTLGFTMEFDRKGVPEYKYFERNRKNDKTRKEWADAHEITKAMYYRDLNKE